MIEKLFSKKIHGINKNIFTISLHPAHAKTNSFRENGQIETFREIVKMKEKYKLNFKSLKKVYKEIKK